MALAEGGTMATPDRITISTEILARTKKAVKIEELPGMSFWIPLSQILESDPEPDEIEVGDDATIVIPGWLAWKIGLID